MSKPRNQRPGQKKKRSGSSSQSPYWQGARKPSSKKQIKEREGRKFERAIEEEEARKQRKSRPNAPPSRPSDEKLVRLNRFIAQAGVCSRREADTLIAEGRIRVNGKVAQEMGLKIHPAKDKVTFRGKELKARNFVYILLNKPKNMITTTDDPHGRPIVLDAIARATNERVYPVGRLDRNTTGLLLLTNDGELAERMTHPSFQVKKVYKVGLNKSVAQKDLDKLVAGVELEDGPAKVDRIDYVESDDQVGVELHIGRNRIVRRMFDHLGYQVLALDRVMIGHITKKNLPRGKWRKLTEKEVGFLKMMGKNR